MEDTTKGVLHGMLLIPQVSVKNPFCFAFASPGKGTAR